MLDQVSYLLLNSIPFLNSPIQWRVNQNCAHMEIEFPKTIPSCLHLHIPQGTWKKNFLCTSIPCELKSLNWPLFIDYQPKKIKKPLTACAFALPWLLQFYFSNFYINERIWFPEFRVLTPFLYIVILKPLFFKKKLTVLISRFIRQPLGWCTLTGPP